MSIKGNLYKKIINSGFTVPNFLSEPLKDLIKKILVKDPNKRYSIKEIKEHPWMKCDTIKISDGLLITSTPYIYTFP